MTPTLMLEAWQVGGLVGLLVIYLLSRDYLRDARDTKREDALVRRINEIEAYQRTELYTLATEANKALIESSKAQLEVARVVNNLAIYVREAFTILKTKPCVAKDIESLDGHRRLSEEDNVQSGK